MEDLFWLLAEACLICRLAGTYMGSIYVYIRACIYGPQRTHTLCARAARLLCRCPVINHKNMFQSPEMQRRSRRLVTRWKMVNACKIAESCSRCGVAVGNWDWILKSGPGIGFVTGLLRWSRPRASDNTQTTAKCQTKGQQLSLFPASFSLLISHFSQSRFSVLHCQIWENFDLLFAKNYLYLCSSFVCLSPRGAHFQLYSCVEEC